jgi:hypothetical protein
LDQIAFLERLENDQDIPTPLPLTLLALLARKHHKVLHNSLTKSANHLLKSKTSSNMAEATTFATRLTALGFEQLGRNALALQGLQTAADLLSLKTKDLEKLISHCQNKVRNMARDPAIPRPVFLFLAVKRLQAFYLWTSYQDSRGQPICPVLFLLAVTTRWLDQIAFLERLENDQEIPTPLPLTSFDDWVVWLESLLAWACHMRSARTGTPFSYLL